MFTFGISVSNHYSNTFFIKKISTNEGLEFVKLLCIIDEILGELLDTS
jgi:hypothetical protein